jgi:hypothetical protein
MEIRVKPFLHFSHVAGERMDPPFVPTRNLRQECNVSETIKNPGAKAGVLNFWI